ncbi:DUF362 domain-containing protein [Desulfovibrio sulfodismutans]|uniref:DUF362 domain-containing protein n=1 Tax=Desulfolutivibrio sulfodismutans TaxID=63561 RepID=A0A7K3NL11_9BACT|nr:DUF362 domain-containing protein [Desulfolutivibrio sulfodismutans]NDY56884.1 DUF362 domain-containing protein [Desulfolutivibrio sulfodismutans]QLA10813.1 DUF362 domain-containing protein [Desulfolutivibrio sulfodismutans DSM 3696]
MTIPVYFSRRPDYEPSRLERTVAELLPAAGFRPAPGTHVLVKPNLVAPRRTHLSCTHPAVVRAACIYLLACGARVTVGDSPAFGTARAVARICGLPRALADLPVRLVNFTRARPVPLSFGGTIGVASQALEADSILSVPRLKVHDQMGLTCAVKNTFGCVAGSRKALAHQIHGERGNRFPRLILDVMAALPPLFHLVDGITAMHRAGPIGGDPFELGLLAASDQAVALDTALCTLTGMPPELVPLWREALACGMPGSRPEDISYPLLSPEDFDAAGFLAPAALSPVAFRPWRFVTGRVKSLFARFR